LLLLLLLLLAMQLAGRRGPVHMRRKHFDLLCHAYCVSICTFVLVKQVN
jgi:hypothetical protein